ncbi:MAG: hypothetical protein JXB62_10815 [Pirellulales bacterium]|nr:hypothetical protein [Pirellulales bacterium]
MNSTLMKMAIGLSFAAMSAVAAPADELWSLGAKDGNYAEFALAGDFASFTKSIPADLVVRGDDPQAASKWPWIHPGPADDWAGGKAHALAVEFDVPADRQVPAVELVVDLVAGHWGRPPILEIDLNGQKRSLQIEPGARGDAVLEDPKQGRPTTHRACFLAEAIRPQGNRLTITNRDGSWVLYDRIQMNTRSVGVDEIALKPAPGVLRDPQTGKTCRRLLVDYRGGILAKEVTLSAATAAGTVEKRLSPKENLLEAEILVPVEMTDQPVSVSATLRVGERQIRQEATLAPERPWEVYLVHQTHLDIGYTHVQEDVLARQVQALKDSLEFVDQTKDYPQDARFRWHPEGMWAVEEFFRTAGDEEKKAFVEAAQRRDIHLDAMYAQAMTGMYNDEELLELLACAKRFGREHSVTVDSAMQSDVPGYTWGLVPALAHNGVKYMTMGPNPGHRVGRLYHWADKPFYWESPSGKHRVLCWLSGFGYHQWHGQPIGHRLRPERVFGMLEQLEQKQFPYDVVMLRYCIEGDNGRPNRVISDVVRQWNQQYVYPKLILARNSQVMAELERRYGDQLPVVRGDYTPYWEDGCASTSRATALNRGACERIVQAQTLWALLRPEEFPAERFDQAWTNLIMYDEHTWGAHCSISQPDDPFTVRQDEYKQNYARRGAQMTDELLAEAAGKAATRDAACIDVLNTASWPRTELVIVSASAEPSVVRDAQGNVVPSQRLGDGRLAFRATEVPPLGAKRYFLSAGKPKAEGSAKADADALTVGNDLLSVRIDPQSGAIGQLQRRGIDANLVSPGEDGNRGLNDYLHILGRDPTENRLRHSDGVTVRVRDAGPLVATLDVASEAPNCRRLVRRLTVIDGCDAVQISNTLDKIMERRPEGTFFGFPLNVPKGTWHIDIPWAVIVPERDQLPGANRNYYCVQRWCDLSNDAYGVTWVAHEANMMQFAPILYTPAVALDAWRETIQPGGTIYSWVCNNHWETNYKAGQEGEMTFRYVLRPHAGPYDQADAQRFARAVHQPLLALTADASRPVRGSLLALDNDALVVTALKPCRDGRGLLVRLFNTTDQPQQASIRWTAEPQEVYVSNPLEDRTERAPEILKLAPYEIVTLRTEEEKGQDDAPTSSELAR